MRSIFTNFEKIEDIYSKQVSNKFYENKMAVNDAMSNMHSGDNDHPELEWSNDMQEKIAQFDFQCVRTAEANISNLAQILDEMLGELTRCTDANHRELLVLLYKIIGKTRDIHGGKGEYALSYMMVWIWYKYYPVLTKTALRMFVLGAPEHALDTPYGSWKDMKYFCKYVLDQTGDKSHPLIQYCIEHLNFQLCMDDEMYNSSSVADEKNISLVSKWIPRESSKFGWMYENLAVQYYPEYMEKVRDRVLTDPSRMKAIKKCKTQYRMLLSKLNRHIDTVQIKQTSQNWTDINHAKTTSITMAKQRKAFLNQKKGGDIRSEDPDRVACAENLRSYLESLKKEGKEVKGKHVGLEMFTAQALQLFEYGHDSVANREEADILNSQWRDNSNIKNADGLGPMIAMVDTSGSMDGDPMHAAIALGCRVAEKSCLGKRVLTFSAEPEWINLDGKETFTDMVSAIMMKNGSAGLNTDFYKALDMILTAIEVHGVHPEDVENMILAIFSDMQIDDNLSCMNGGSYGPNDSQKIEARRKWATMHEQIKAKYAEVGMRLYGRSLSPPHILFWNLRKTSGFPTLSTEAGCSMMSGYDPTVLNMFCEIGMQALREMTPYKMLTKLLDNVRYLPMEKAIREYFAHM